MSVSVTRREFVAGAAALASAPNQRSAPSPNMPSPTAASPTAPLRFGMIADIHHGLMPKAEERLEAFLEDASRRSLDFVIQLGDFGFAREDARAFATLWLRHPGAKYSVLGNHDMDHNTKDEFREFYEMPRNYYGFDAGSFRFLVLDCNHLNFDGRFEHYAHGNYFGNGDRRDWVDAEQLEWFRAELAAATEPVIVFSHQGIGPYWGSPMTARQGVRQAIATQNSRHRVPKVIAAFCGHDHVDDHSIHDGTHYLQVNSASYHWVGEEYGSLAKYRDPLYAFVELDPAGLIRIEGRESAWVPPTPAERGLPRAPRLLPSILSRTLSFATPA